MVSAGTPCLLIWITSLSVTGGVDCATPRLAHPPNRVIQINKIKVGLASTISSPGSLSSEQTFLLSPPKVHAHQCAGLENQRTIRVSLHTERNSCHTAK